MPVTLGKRAVRHPAAGLGWLYLQEREAQQLEGGPPQQHPDPKISGQNPEYTAWAWAQTRQFAHLPGYRKQIEDQAALLEKQAQVALAALAAAADELDRIEAERAMVLSLLPLEAQP